MVGLPSLHNCVSQFLTISHACICVSIGSISLGNPNTDPCMESLLFLLLSPVADLGAALLWNSELGVARRGTLSSWQEAKQLLLENVKGISQVFFFLFLSFFSFPLSALLQE